MARSEPEEQQALDREDRRAFQRLFEEATARWSGGEHDAEYAESWPAFLARADAAVGRALARDGVTVAVSSGGPIAAACAILVDPAATPEEVPRLWNAFNTVTVNASVTRVLAGLDRPPPAVVQRALPPPPRAGHLPLGLGGILRM